MKIKIKNYVNFTPKFALGQIVNYKSDYNSYYGLRILAIIYFYKDKQNVVTKSILHLPQESLNHTETQAIKTFIDNFRADFIEIDPVQIPAYVGYVAIFPNDGEKASWDSEDSFYI